MIRSSKSTLRFSRKGKLDTVRIFIEEYRNVVKQFVDMLWEQEKISNLLEKEITDRVDSWLSERMKQCAGKQASGIVRGTRKKQEKREWKIRELEKQGRLKQMRKLQRIYDQVKVSKPKIEQVQPELDARFVKLDLENGTSFDGWLTLSSIGNKIKIELPFKKTRHFNKMVK